VVSVELSQGDERERAYDSSRARPDEVIVAGAFAVVLMNMISTGIVVALQGAGVARVLDVLGDLLGPIVRGGQTMKWTVGSIQREDGRWWTYRHWQRIHGHSGKRHQDTSRKREYVSQGRQVGNERRAYAHVGA